jgi:hypothetical protein
MNEFESLVSPTCCSESLTNKSVYLELPESFYEGDLTTPPTWKMKGHIKFKQIHHRGPVAPKFCPFCSKKLPEIIPSNEVKKIRTVTDGGYYCATCGDRLRTCKCLPGEFRWKAEIMMPDIELLLTNAFEEVIAESTEPHKAYWYYEVIDHRLQFSVDEDDLQAIASIVLLKVLTKFAEFGVDAVLTINEEDGEKIATIKV